MHTQYCKALIREASRKMLKGIVEHFAKYSYSLYCWELDEKIDTSHVQYRIC